MTAARIITGLVLIPAVVAIVWWGSPALVAAFVALVTVLALLEFFALGKQIGLHGYRWWTCACALAVLLQQWAVTRTQQYSLTHDLPLTQSPMLSWLSPHLILLLFVFGAAAHIFFSPWSLHDALGDIGLSSAALIFIALPASTLIRLDGVPAIGPRLLLFVLVLVWAGDTLAYFTGRAIGRTRLAPQLSPGKTWEGAAANVLGSLAVGAAFARWLQLDAANVLIMAALGSIAGQAGDLLESAYKRSAGVKDSGALLPGHGGMLDRIDALLLAAPVVWYYFELVLAK